MSIDADAFRDFERRAHDRVARTYVDFFEPVTAGAIPTLLDAAGVAAGSRVLDVACGPGAVAAAAAERGAAVIAVDLSPEMLAVARTRHSGLDFREADAERLPFGEGAFDAVVCNFGLGHFPRPERVAAEFVRVLAPGGHVALSWWDLPSRAPINGLFFDALTDAGAEPPAAVPTGPPVYRFAADAELRALLTIAGFADAGVRVLAWTHHIESIDAWWEGGLASLARASAVVVHQTPVIQARIRAAFERRAAGYATDAGLVVPVSAKVAAGRR